MAEFFHFDFQQTGESSVRLIFFRSTSKILSLKPIVSIVENRLATWYCGLDFFILRLHHVGELLQSEGGNRR